ncbi:MAG: TonB-dependent receptor plug domain-containing protein [Candidatus Latescibacteria bacterium]|nr:TonB-dependent receptor plug domain-containing protein [Candidatus Latescibacterota bacterium]
MNKTMINLVLVRMSCILLVIFLFCSFSDCLAQEENSSRPVYLMEELVVTDSVRTSASEMSITSDMIRIQRPASSADILGGVYGASVTAGHKNSSEIMIRGFTSRDVLIMVDGRPINEPYYGKIDLSTLGVGDIEKIKIVKGATSVRYGPNAMGGVVNLITDESDDGPLTDVRLSAGSGEEIRTNIVHRRRMEKIGYRIHVGRSTTAGFPLSSGFESTALEDGDMRNNSDYSRTDLGVKLLFGPRDNSQWRLNIGGSHLTKGLPSSVYEPRFWRFRKWNRMSANLDGEPIRTQSWKVKAKLYADRFQNELVDYRDEQYDISNVFWISAHDNRSAGLLISSSYFPGGNGVSNFGVQMRWDESRRQADSGYNWFINRTVTTWVFAEHERSITPNLFLRGGISGLLLSYNSWDNTAASVNPSFHLEWLFGGNTITGSVSRVSRFPTLHHLFSITSGNPDLNPEWAYKWEMSISRTLFDFLDFSVTGFMNQLHDMIYRSGRLNIYNNVEKASLDGVEISGVVQNGAFKLCSSVATLDAHDGDGKKLEYRPAWKADVFFNYQIISTVNFYLTMRAVSERRTEINTYLDPYHVENTGLLFEVKRNITVSFHLKNIFDIDYEEEYGYPTMGRTVLIGLDWRWSRN